jgi:hypothetical protein
MLTADDIKKRWLQSWEAKRDELDRIEKAYLWLYEFERHLKRGEEGRAAYRFPEVMGYVLRRYNNLLEILPEARVRGNGDGAIGLQTAVEHYSRVSNLDKVKLEVLADTAAIGSGCFAVMPTIWKRKFKDGKEKIQYNGLGAERVDWRHIFPASGYKSLHDHTGQNQMPYLFRRKIWHIDTFKAKFEGVEGYKDLDKVKATMWNNANVWGDENWQTPHETQETLSALSYVVTLEYWDIINDILSTFATGGVHIYESAKGNPLSHKMFPFHQYRNVPRLDSINGLGEIEINLPYNLFRERMLNLGIMDSELTVQPAQIIAGDVNFNTEENELEPGAQFNLRGTGFSGDIRNHVMPYQAGGGLSANVFQMISLIENSRIAVTSDDTTSLYSNPNQLATQTLAKVQTLNKSVDGTTKRNVYDAEFYLTNHIVSYICNELSEPYKDGKETKRREIVINGYDVVQDNKESDVKFVKGYGAVGKFVLNSKTSDLFKNEEIEIVSAKKDEELKRDRTEKLMQMTQTIFTTVANLASVAPQLIQQIFGNMDFPEYIKFMAKNLGVESEMKEIFPVVTKDSYQIDAIEEEHKQIMMGITPPMREEEDSTDELMKHMRERDSNFFKQNASKKAKEAMSKHISLTIQNAYEQNAKPIADRKKGMERSEGTNGGQGLQGNAPVVGSPTAFSGATGGLQPSITPAQPNTPVGAATGV